MKLYRGFKNIYEMRTVLENQTAGGLKSLCLSDFYNGIDGAGVITDNRKELRENLDILNEEEIGRLKNYMRKHRGSDGEGTCNLTYLPVSRCVIEYTESKEIASSFGRLLGHIEVEVDDKYVAEDSAALDGAKKSPEAGVYLYSHAPVNITEISINDRNLNMDPKLIDRMLIVMIQKNLENDIDYLKKLAEKYKKK